MDTSWEFFLGHLSQIQANNWKSRAISNVKTVWWESTRCDYVSGIHCQKKNEVVTMSDNEDDTTGL